MNLTATNLDNQTHFELEYTARKAFELDDLSPASWHSFLQRLENNIDGSLMDRVYQFFMKSSPINTICNQTCRLNLLNCHFKRARAQDTQFCKTLNK